MSVSGCDTFVQCVHVRLGVPRESGSWADGERERERERDKFINNQEVTEGR